MVIAFEELTLQNNFTNKYVLLNDEQKKKKTIYIIISHFLQILLKF